MYEPATSSNDDTGRAVMAARFRRVAAGFTERIGAVTDWDAPSPCPGWTARDVVGHLVEWVPGMIGNGAGVTFPALPDDGVAAWPRLRDALQGFLDDETLASRSFDNPHTGRHRLDAAIDQFVTGDVLMHTWDLARAAGLDERLDPEAVAVMLPGVEAMGDALAQSGQFGPATPVPPGADDQTRLICLMGRRP